MTATRLRIFILGFTAIAIPAKASLSFEASQSTFTNQATTTDGLVVSSLFTFTGSLTQFGSVANDEYIDLTTGVEFIAFNGTGTANKAFAPISGGDLNTVASQGDAIEVILPAGTYWLAFNFTTVFSSGDNLCVDTTVSGCSGGAFIAQNGSGFVGTLNDNPTPAHADHDLDAPDNQRGHQPPELRNRLPGTRPRRRNDAHSRLRPHLSSPSNCAGAKIHVHSRPLTAR